MVKYWSKTALFWQKWQILYIWFNYWNIHDAKATCWTKICLHHMQNTYRSVLIFPKIAMVRNSESILPGGMANISFQLFALQIHFPLIWTPYIFHDHRRIYRFARKRNLWRDENSMGSIEIEDVSFKVILKNCSINWQLLKICWSWPGGWKRGTTHYVIWELIYRFCCISEYFVDPNIT